MGSGANMNVWSLWGSPLSIYILSKWNITETSLPMPHYDFLHDPELIA